MVDRVYSVDERPRDTVVVDREVDDHPARHSNTALIVAVIIITLILLFLLMGRRGGGGTTNISAPAPTVPTNQ